MGSVGNSNPWAPYGNYKDCSQKICSIYCPQWCYIVFPPPPPFGFSDDNYSGADFSPLIIGVIGILASAFLLVSYYTIISKYCRRRGDHNNTSAELDHENRDQMNHDQPWQVGLTGLDDALIKSITVCKFNKGDGLVEGTDCSVCLSEFQEDESLRLLPKCNHAFHLPCIDTWLKSHSTCPLCRSNIAFTNPSLPVPPPQLPATPIPESRPNINISALEYQHRNNDSVLVVHDVEEAVVCILGDKEESAEERENTIEIREEGVQHFRRSVSLDSSSRSRGFVSIADILRTGEDDDDDDDFQVDNLPFSRREYGKANNRSGVLHLVRNPIAMKRSFSTGRFMFSRHGKGRNSIIIPN